MAKAMKFSIVQLWIGKTVLRNVLEGKFASSSSTSTVATSQEILHDRRP